MPIVKDQNDNYNITGDVDFEVLADIPGAPSGNQTADVNRCRTNSALAFIGVGLRDSKIVRHTSGSVLTLRGKDVEYAFGYEPFCSPGSQLRLLSGSEIQLTGDRKFSGLEGLRIIAEDSTISYISTVGEYSQFRPISLDAKKMILADLSPSGTLVTLPVNNLIVGSQLIIDKQAYSDTSDTLYGTTLACLGLHLLDGISINHRTGLFKIVGGDQGVYAADGSLLATDEANSRALNLTITNFVAGFDMVGNSSTLLFSHPGATPFSLLDPTRNGVPYFPMNIAVGEVEAKTYSTIRAAISFDRAHYSADEPLDQVVSRFFYGSSIPSGSTALVAVKEMGETENIGTLGSNTGITHPTRRSGGEANYYTKGLSDVRFGTDNRLLAGRDFDSAATYTSGDEYDVRPSAGLRWVRHRVTESGYTVLPTYPLRGSSKRNNGAFLVYVESDFDFYPDGYIPAVSEQLTYQVPSSMGGKLDGYEEYPSLLVYVTDSGGETKLTSVVFTAAGGANKVTEVVIPQAHENLIRPPNRLLLVWTGKMHLTSPYADSYFHISVRDGYRPAVEDFTFAAGKVLDTEDWTTRRDKWWGDISSADIEPIALGSAQPEYDASTNTLILSPSSDVQNLRQLYAATEWRNNREEVTGLLSLPTQNEKGGHPQTQRLFDRDAPVELDGKINITRFNVSLNMAASLFFSDATYQVRGFKCLDFSAHSAAENVLNADVECEKISFFPPNNFTLDSGTFEAQSAASDIPKMTSASLIIGRGNVSLPYGAEGSTITTEGNLTIGDTCKNNNFSIKGTFSPSSIVEDSTVECAECRSTANVVGSEITVSEIMDSQNSDIVDSRVRLPLTAHFLKYHRVGEIRGTTSRVGGEHAPHPGSESIALMAAGFSEGLISDISFVELPTMTGGTIERVVYFKCDTPLRGGEIVGGLGNDGQLCSLVSYPVSSDIENICYYNSSAADILVEMTNSGRIIFAASCRGKIKVVVGPVTGQTVIDNRSVALEIEIIPPTAQNSTANVVILSSDSEILVQVPDVQGVRVEVEFVADGVSYYSSSNTPGKLIGIPSYLAENGQTVVATFSAPGYHLQRVTYVIEGERHTIGFAECENGYNAYADTKSTIFSKVEYDGGVARITLSDVDQTIGISGMVRLMEEGLNSWTLPLHDDTSTDDSSPLHRLIREYGDGIYSSYGSETLSIDTARFRFTSTTATGGENKEIIPFMRPLSGAASDLKKMTDTSDYLSISEISHVYVPPITGVTQAVEEVMDARDLTKGNVRKLSLNIPIQES